MCTYVYLIFWVVVYSLGIIGEAAITRRWKCLKWISYSNSKTNRRAGWCILHQRDTREGERTHFGNDLLVYSLWQMYKELLLLETSLTHVSPYYCCYLLPLLLILLCLWVSVVFHFPLLVYVIFTVALKEY